MADDDEESRRFGARHGYRRTRSTSYQRLELTDPPDRYWSGMTGSRRAYRGRGLVKLVKAASLHRAGQAGLTEAYTGNDEQNAPMLAVNSWLGYRPYAVQWHCVRELS